jgi:hypothetical protein
VPAYKERENKGNEFGGRSSRAKHNAKAGGLTRQAWLRRVPPMEQGRGEQ